MKNGKKGRGGEENRTTLFFYAARHKSADVRRHLFASADPWTLTNLSVTPSCHLCLPVCVGLFDCLYGLSLPQPIFLYFFLSFSFVLLKCDIRPGCFKLLKIATDCTLISPPFSQRSKLSVRLCVSPAPPPPPPFLSVSLSIPPPLFSLSHSLFPPPPFFPSQFFFFFLALSLYLFLCLSFALSFSLYLPSVCLSQYLYLHIYLILSLCVRCHESASLSL